MHNALSIFSENFCLVCSLTKCLFFVRSALPFCALTNFMPIIDYGGFRTTPALGYMNNGRCWCGRSERTAQEHAALGD